ncbi:MAG: dTDP-4-dehydrorhamnose 3,5-epimerase [Pirellulales bacterium]
MRFLETRIAGSYLIDLEPIVDDRGFFARVFCLNQFAEYELTERFVQINNSYSAEKATLRGLHYQLPPKAENKLVRCIRGAVWDCIVDLRDDSPTLGQWFGVELSEDNRRMIYIPKGFAHGYITLTTNAELLYMTDEFYHPDCERGVRWNDPTFGIRWPLDPQVITERDCNFDDFDPSGPLSLASGTGIEEIDK